jgi:hypothetical protein
MSRLRSDTPNTRAVKRCICWYKRDGRGCEQSIDGYKKHAASQSARLDKHLSRVDGGEPAGTLSHIVTSRMLASSQFAHTDPRDTSVSVVIEPAGRPVAVAALPSGTAVPTSVSSNHDPEASRCRRSGFVLSTFERFASDQATA